MDEELDNGTQALTFNQEWGRAGSGVPGTIFVPWASARTTAVPRKMRSGRTEVATDLNPGITKHMG